MGIPAWNPPLNSPLAGDFGRPGDRVAGQLNGHQRPATVQPNRPFLFAEARDIGFGPVAEMTIDTWYVRLRSEMPMAWPLSTVCQPARCGGREAKLCPTALTWKQARLCIGLRACLVRRAARRSAGPPASAKCPRTACSGSATERLSSSTRPARAITPLRRAAGPALASKNGPRRQTMLNTVRSCRSCRSGRPAEFRPPRPR